MVTFYISAKKEAVTKLFYDMTVRGMNAAEKLPEKMMTNYINPACLWCHESKGDKHKIEYLGFPIGGYIFYLIFKLAFRIKYKESCKRIKKRVWEDG